MRIQLNYTKQGWPHNNYLAQCPRCDSFEAVQELPTSPKRCIWCNDVETTLTCDTCKQPFLTTLDTLTQFEEGQLMAAMCEPCLDRQAETQARMLF
jgi:hypothetical protein